MIIDFNKQNGGSADLSKYWNSAQTESAIEQATENFVTSGEVQEQIDNSISGISIDLSDYYTSAQTENAIDEAISEIVIPDVSNFVTSGQVQEQIDASISGISVDLSAYWTSAQTQTVIDGVVDILQRDEQVTSAALNELHNSIISIINYISGTTV